MRQGPAGGGMGVVDPGRVTQPQAAPVLRTVGATALLKDINATAQTRSLPTLNLAPLFVAILSSFALSL